MTPYNKPRFFLSFLACSCALTRTFIASQLMEGVYKIVADVKTTEMDYKGQLLAKKILYAAMSIGTVIACAFGFISGNFPLMCGVTTGITVFTAVAVVPSWPFYRRNLIDFRVSEKESSSEDEDESDTEE